MAKAKAAAPIEGRIKGFDNLWNQRFTDIISKEDKGRWESLDKQMEIMRASGVERRPVKLPRAHSSIGPYPGCHRIVQLSPRKSAAVCYIEQKLLRSSSMDPLRPTIRERLYEGVSQQEQGRFAYLKLRHRLPMRERFGDDPLTASSVYGFTKPMGEYRASHFSHKPGVETAFLRPNGVITYKDLPPTSK